MMTKFEKVLTSGQTILTIQDLAVIWNQSDRSKIWESVKYYLRIGKLHKLYSGVYALSQKYSELELAVNLFPPAYISFYTALGIHGISFQYYHTVHAMALSSKNFLVDGRDYEFHQLKDTAFFNDLGIESEENYQLASPERAICDSLYLVPSMTFDHLDDIEWSKLNQVAAIYSNQSLQKRVWQLTERYADA